MTEVNSKQVFSLDETQMEAVNACVNQTRRIVAITGEAGTGKTTILKRVFNKLTDLGLNVVLCAPTGKAAKRIHEATGIKARTIHRLLEYPHPGELNPKTGTAYRTTDPKRDKRNPLEFGVVLADEYIMVNNEVHRNLLDALPRGGLLRVFGDANQLQPIESNKRLAKLAPQFVQLLNKFDGIRLQTIHRQDEDSSIVSNGHRIINGVMPKQTDDFKLVFTNTPVEQLSDFIMEKMEQDIYYSDLNKQMISPTKLGWVGSESLNALVQGFYQPTHKPFIEIERHTWSSLDSLSVYVGDKVIFTVNNYNLEVFNGETGIVKEIDEAQQIIIDFSDREVTIPPLLEVDTKYGSAYINPQKDIDLAYVITTHKAQGSEYEEVVYIMNKSRTWTLNRKNFYTGTSRAKKHVTVITDQRALQLSLLKKGDW